MIPFLFRRLLLMLLTLFTVVSLTFLLMRLAPGNPFSADRKIPPSILQELESKYGLSGTIGQQYRSYLKDVIRGDLRISTKYRDWSVNEILSQTLPVSMALGSAAFCLTLLIGISLGSFAALYQGQWQDRSFMFIALLGISIPSYILAPLFILFFGLHLGWLPVAGFGNWDQWILPVFCLALPFSASVARLVRTSLLDVLTQDFIRTARSKGLAESQIIIRHALRVALLPVLSYAGPLAANLLTGSMVVEQIFKIPGMGPFFINSVLNRDLFVVGGIVLVFSLILMSLNLFVDLLYTVLDRRIKLS